MNALAEINERYKQQEKMFSHWELIKDCVDQYIDMMLNYRQSGHPGGSRSKVHALVAATLSGAMRWDIRRPELAFADRFVLVAGHCAPLIYAMLPVYNEALREMLKRTGDEKYVRRLSPEDEELYFRLAGDPGEQESRLDEAGERVRVLREEMESAMTANRFDFVLRLEGDHRYELTLRTGGWAICSRS